MKVIVFPKDNNPYQDFLYNNFDQKNFTYKYLYFHKTDKSYLNLVILLINILYLRFNGFRIFHLHFLYNFSSYSKHKWVKDISLYFYFFFIIFFVTYIRLLGYKLVWTMHEIKPHDKQTINDIFISKYIVKLSNRVIIHSKMTLEKFKENNININNVSIIPIGNYNNYYKNKITKERARKILNLNNTDFIFLFFGLVKKYKGIEDLVTAFEKLKFNNKVKLLIVGQIYDEAVKNNILRAVIKNKNIIPVMEFIKDEDIQIYLKACDIVTLPYRKITTSSSTLLSFAFQKPIIFPIVGDLAELPENIGYKYKVNDLHDLANVMKQAYTNRNKLPELGKNAYKYSKKFDWSKISAITYELYKSL